MNFPEKLEILVITLSDRAYRGEYKDLSGPGIKEMLSGFFAVKELEVSVDTRLLPDDSELLRNELLKAITRYNIIVTSGGTGIGPRDITVETVKPMLEKELPGIMEYIRVKYGAEKPNALLSRGVAGIAGKSVIYTLPGSVKAVEEYMHEILKTLMHVLQMQYGIDTHSKH
ncbi:MAG TPA: MogA/MoaB family molybdenum cofactor biosynthesis protein [Bacteroidales bacterium]|nr:MogA/MoaB family molybdenum cofactor biosynthesis protein [Bacteroidales bacterium]